jgi:hypothetical protein
MQPEREIQRRRECAPNEQPGHRLRQGHGFDVGWIGATEHDGDTRKHRVAVPQQEAQRRTHDRDDEVRLPRAVFAGVASLTMSSWRSSVN